MLEGQLMPQLPVSLASVLAITYIGSRKLPKDWLKATFRVRRHVVHDALCWLQINNPFYNNIRISGERVNALPEDDVPEELLAIIRQEGDANIAVRESESYVPSCSEIELGSASDTAGGNHDTDLDVSMERYDNDDNLLAIHDESSMVIPLQCLGVSDVDLTRGALNDLMAYGLGNLIADKDEGGYAVHYSRSAVSDFGRDTNGRERWALESFS
ncbi:hypothetical protein JVU11DRAFT_9161 [Chiua virens]|nr:hypothetical protein JVU11DRAFT_9161 [Chiua virens]